MHSATAYDVEQPSSAINGCLYTCGFVFQISFGFGLCAKELVVAERKPSRFFVTGIVSNGAGDEPGRDSRRDLISIMDKECALCL